MLVTRTSCVVDDHIYLGVRRALTSLAFCAWPMATAHRNWALSAHHGVALCFSSRARNSLLFHWPILCFSSTQLVHVPPCSRCALIFCFACSRLFCLLLSLLIEHSLYLSTSRSSISKMSVALGGIGPWGEESGG